MNDLLNNLFFVFSQKVLIAETRLNLLSGDINKVLLIKTTLQQLMLFDYATNNYLFKHFMLSKHCLFSIPLAPLN